MIEDAERMTGPEEPPLRGGAPLPCRPVRQEQQKQKKLLLPPVPRGRGRRRRGLKWLNGRGRCLRCLEGGRVATGSCLLGSCTPSSSVAATGGLGAAES